MHILLVDDGPGDAMLVEEALRTQPWPVELTFATDGQEALDLLGARTGDASAPDLILRDLNMPRMSGHELLALIKANEALKHIPVVVLTTSAAQDDVLTCYQRRAAAFVSKPVDFDDFGVVVRKIDAFYRRTARLPPRTAPV